MSNQTTVSTTSAAGAVAVIVTFILGQFGVELTPEVSASLAVLFSSVAGAILNR